MNVATKSLVPRSPISIQVRIEPTRLRAVMAHVNDAKGRRPWPQEGQATGEMVGSRPGPKSMPQAGHLP
jgi:hypothetical protein